MISVKKIKSSLESDMFIRLSNGITSSNIACSQKICRVDFKRIFQCNFVTTLWLSSVSLHEMKQLRSYHKLVLKGYFILILHDIPEPMITYRKKSFCKHYLPHHKLQLS